MVAPLHIITLILFGASLFACTIGVTIYVLFKYFAKRDGSLTLNICFLDILYSIIFVYILQMLRRPNADITFVLLSYYACGAYLLSWFNQFAIILFRWIVIHYPFTYKRLVNKYRSCCFVIAIWISVVILLVATSLLSRIPQNKDTKKRLENLILLDEVFHSMSIYFSATAFSCLFFISVMCFIVEIRIQRTAVSHYRKSNSFRKVYSVKNPEKTLSRKTSKTRLLSIRQAAIVQTKKKSFVIAAIQSISVALFFLLCVRYFIQNRCRENCSPVFLYIGYAQQIMLSVRPLLNVFNFISLAKLRRFLRYLYRYLFLKKEERLTEYYVEYSVEVKQMKQTRRYSQELAIATASKRYTTVHQSKVTESTVVEEDLSFL